MLDAAELPHVREITVICGSQMSKTEALINLALARLDEGPRYPTVLVEPSQNLARRIADRVDAAIRLVPELYAMTVRGRKERLMQKMIAGVRFAITYAGSKIELSSDPYGLALCDEIDRYPTDVEGEGDPVTLVSGRLKTYRRSLLFRTTTPTVRGASAGEKAFEEGTMEIWQWKCPDCREWFQPLPAWVRWKDPAELGMHCPHCGHVLTDDEGVACRNDGRYWPHTLAEDGTPQPCETDEHVAQAMHRSFWITGAQSWAVTLSELSQRLRRAYQSGDPERIQAELNVWWGCWWETSGDRPDWERVRSHCGSYMRGQLPDQCRGLTLGVDVQRDRLVWCVMGFGPNFRKWIVDHGTLWGDPAESAVWGELAAMQGARYGHLGIKRALIDSGYRPGYDHYRRPDHIVYQVARQLRGWAFAYKGFDGAQSPIRPSKGKEQGILWLGDSSYYKTLIYSEIRADEQRLQVPADITEEACKELVSEDLVQLPSGKLVWRAYRHRPNHLLDCCVMAIAAAQTLNWQQWKVEDLRPNAPKPTQIRSDFSLRR